MKEDNVHSNDTNGQDPEVQALLDDYPAPVADPLFYEQALVRATFEGTRRQRNRWLLTGFGSAVAAGLALWIIGGFFLATPDMPVVDPAIPDVTMTLEEPRIINLVFASAAALDSALLTVTLPDGIEIDGFPGQREIAWRTTLNEGKNYLPLKLVAVSPVGGELLARLEHEDRDRTFRLRIDVS